MGGGGAHRAKAEVVCAMEPRVGGPGGGKGKQERRGGQRREGEGGKGEKGSGEEEEGGSLMVSGVVVGGGKEM